MKPVTISLRAAPGELRGIGAGGLLWLALLSSTCELACESQPSARSESSASIGRAQQALSRADSASKVAAAELGALGTDAVLGVPTRGDVGVDPLPVVAPPTAEIEPLPPVVVAEPASEPSPAGPSAASPPPSTPPGALLEQLLTSPTVAVAEDASGNRCLAGGFAGAIKIDEQVFTANGARDIYVARFAPGGALSWATSFGNGDDQLATGVALGPNGSCVIAGLFQGDLELGSFQLHSTVQYPSYAVYVAEVSRSRIIQPPPPPFDPGTVLSAASARANAGVAPAAPLLNARPVEAPPVEVGPIELDPVEVRPVVDPLPVPPDVLAPPDDLVNLSQFTVRDAQIIAPFMAPGVTVGVSVDSAGQYHVALPDPPYQDPSSPFRILRLDQPKGLTIPAGACPGYDTFDLCQAAPVSPAAQLAPKRSCLIGRDSATLHAVDDVCEHMPECCEDKGAAHPLWSPSCVSYLNSISSICECKSAAALVSLVPGQAALPLQDPCCNAITSTVCAQAPQCCSVKWNYVCASFAASNGSNSCE